MILSICLVLNSAKRSGDLRRNLPNASPFARRLVSYWRRKEKLWLKDRKEEYRQQRGKSRREKLDLKQQWCNKRLKKIHQRKRCEKEKTKHLRRAEQIHQEKSSKSGVLLYFNNASIEQYNYLSYWFFFCSLQSGHLTNNLFSFINQKN